MKKRVYKFIDIHSHVLPNVDDGSDYFDTSLSILKKQESIGVEKIILTPHFMGSTYNILADDLQKKFLDFKNKIKDNGVNIELFLGQEVYCDSDIYDNLKNGVVCTLNNTKYLLIEFGFIENTHVIDYVYNLTAMGYIPVIAHVERYDYLDAETLIDLKQMGALIQVNAESIVGINGKTVQKYVLEGIQKGIVDFVASDIHSDRKIYLEKAYKMIVKNLGEEYAQAIFYENAKRYLITD